MQCLMPRHGRPFRNPCRATKNPTAGEADDSQQMDTSVRPVILGYLSFMVFAPWPQGGLGVRCTPHPAEEKHMDLGKPLRFVDVCRGKNMSFSVSFSESMFASESDSPRAGQACPSLGKTT